MMHGQPSIKIWIKIKILAYDGIRQDTFPGQLFQKSKIKCRNGNKCAVWMSPLITHQCYLPADMLFVVLQFQALGPNHVHF